jgi:hypothetical protein
VVTPLLCTSHPQLSTRHVAETAPRVAGVAQCPPDQGQNAEALAALAVPTLPAFWDI